MARLVAGVGALIGLVGLGLQYWLLYADMTSHGVSPVAATWRYFAYFTILTNTFVTLVMARAMLKPTSNTGLNATHVELMAVTSILFVCIVYNMLLAARWNPQGWQKVADVIVHQIVPIVFAIYWALRPHGALKWKDAAFASIWPAAYAVYGLTRGAFDGFYPYFFMDPTTTPIPQLAINMLGLVLSFVIGALALIAASRALGARRAAS
jgi:hypothetical protein